MDYLIGAVRHGARQFRVSRVFTAVTVLTLALGIGGATAIFTLVDAVMLRPLPVPDPASVYRIGDGDQGGVEGGLQGRLGMFTFPLYRRLAGSAPEFDEITAFFLR